MFFKHLLSLFSRKQLTIELKQMDLGNVALEDLLAGNAEKKQFHVKNISDAPFAEIVECPVQWLIIEPSRWRVSPGEIQTVTIQPKATGMCTGTHRTELYFPHHGQHLSVRLNVIPQPQTPPTIDCKPIFVTMRRKERQRLPLEIVNKGTKTLVLQEIIVNESWIRVKVRRRMFHKRAVKDIYVIVDGRRMPKNDNLFIGSIIIRSNNQKTPLTQVPITVTLEDDRKE